MAAASVAAASAARRRPAEGAAKTERPGGRDAPRGRSGEVGSRRPLEAAADAVDPRRGVNKERRYMGQRSGDGARSSKGGLVWWFHRSDPLHSQGGGGGRAPAAGGKAAHPEEVSETGPEAPAGRLPRTGSGAQPSQSWSRGLRRNVRHSMSTLKFCGLLAGLQLWEETAAVEGGSDGRRVILLIPTAPRAESGAGGC